MLQIRIKKLRLLNCYFLITFITLIFFTSNLTNSQEKQTVFKNTIHLDFSSLLLVNTYSINYERIVFYRQYFKTGINVGYGGWAFLEGDHLETFWGLPYSLNLIVGRKNHFELNYGMTLLNPFGGKVEYRDRNYPNMSIGYRFQDFNNHESYKVFIGTNGFGLAYGLSF